MKSFYDGMLKLFFLKPLYVLIALGNHLNINKKVMISDWQYIGYFTI